MPARGRHRLPSPAPAPLHTSHLGPSKAGVPPQRVGGLRRHCRQGLPAGPHRLHSSLPSPPLLPARPRPPRGGKSREPLGAAQNRRLYRLRGPAARLPLPTSLLPRLLALPSLPDRSARRQADTGRCAREENRAVSPVLLPPWLGLLPGDSD